ncbi:hypothetical protein CspeluHIS016_0212000 [Cutaneotrichosporon spelunceum]|uniref:Amidohydrolase 3 domain-containing protein n=1 Tax=Cutaneotrichosporon spelunceum TaxID=1672016 RepID=A0AAD3TST9_9TREE|nr:hypothetical protein CspeluHIS016_0212000 [Cutaneotrichosporon spelunceum]
MTTTDLDKAIPSPSTLFTNAKLVGRPAGNYNVLIQDGVVKSITEDDMSLPEGIETIDLKGQWLSPSLIDWHTHFTMNAIASRRLNFYTALSAKEVLEAVRKAINDPAYDEGGRLVGVNVRVGEWTDLPDLNREALDAISHKPIVLILNGYHSGVLNTAALAINGLTPEQYPTGVLEEEPAFAMWGKLQETAPTDVVDRWVADEAARAASLGVTEIVDLEMDHNISVWQRRVGNLFDKLRVHIGFYQPHLHEAVNAGLKMGDAVPHTRELVRAGPVKLITDGSLGSQTAYCCDPYPGTNKRGLFVYEEKELANVMGQATTAGLRVAVHAIGDDAMRITLKSFKAEAAAGRKALSGSTIEHAQLVQQSDIETFAGLGLIASVQPRHMIDDRELCHKFWPGREGRTFPFKWFVEAGIPMKMGTDCPVTELQPWEAMACAVSRAGEGQEPFCPEHLIDIKVAYAASTQNGRLDLVEGDRADLIVLAKDPLQLDAAGLRAMQVEGTMLGGNWTYRK